MKTTDQLAAEAAEKLRLNLQLAYGISVPVEELTKDFKSAIEKALKECHKCDLPDSIKEALNSGDGTYRP